jgi:hypothetical protein
MIDLQIADPAEARAAGESAPRRNVADFFLCHDHDDCDFGEILKYRIEEAGYSAWVDTDNLRPGSDWQVEIDEAIRAAAALIVVMTPSARNSEYVAYEWAFALGVGVRVIPLVRKPTPLHPRLGTLQYLDFTNRTNRPWSQLLHALRQAHHQKRSRGGMAPAEIESSGSPQR